MFLDGFFSENEEQCSGLFHVDTSDRPGRQPDLQESYNVQTALLCQVSGGLFPRRYNGVVA